MAITRPKPKTVDEFIKSAPDAGRKGVRRGNKDQISHTISPELLAMLDEYAAKRSQTRAATINRAIYQMIKGDGPAAGD